MFDFFRDMYYEFGGIDSKVAYEKRLEKKELKRKERFIFSRGMKIMVFVIGILYLVLAGSNISILKQSGNLGISHILRFLFLISCDIACMVCLAIGKKKTEIAALILIVVFFVVQYLTTVFL